ncbi:pyridoxal-phosphate dependent enzyme [Alginatibacterium sediminis]|uniref:Pyridoxal-phosphate dependent enzyme n=1 Tax=Alginatibacterium sediminis TaxID=2164068 RepID=A0A420ECU4_9ALTE|nr:pyridoxal-phosphate dependent enzyme [Alginatibacterium sediminis]RKF18474.1 pyridoxal-phosphate dependent enzyme [Alginatibacterium sediminis]
MIQLSPSPIQSMQFENNSLYIKRDDLLHAQFSGNKARKFQYYLNLNTQLVDKVVAYGSIQANSLYSLAALCDLRSWELEYHCEHIPKHLQDHPSANFAQALALGARIIPFRQSSEKQSTTAFHAHLKAIEQQCTDKTLFIHEGGFGVEARFGVHRLALEIEQWMHEKKLSKLQLVLPSGTGTTAGFLADSFEALQLAVQVITCPCVADVAYLRQQWKNLSIDSQRIQILPNFEDRKFRFGKPHIELFNIWQHVQATTQIEFELLYDPIAWYFLAKALNQGQLTSSDANPILYLHQGGLLANQSMLPRYERMLKKMAS